MSRVGFQFCNLKVSFRRQPLQFRAYSFEVCLVDSEIRILVLLAQGASFFIEGRRQIKATTSLISFCQAVIDVSRSRITFDIGFKSRDRFIGLVSKEKLVTDLIDEVLRNGNLEAELR